MNRRILVPSVAAILVLSAGFVAGEINASRHPHMAAAQKYGTQAFNELGMVDEHNGPAVDAHVNKAKADLQDANKELEEAAHIADMKK